MEILNIDDLYDSESTNSIDSCNSDDDNANLEDYEERLNNIKYINNDDIIDISDDIHISDDILTSLYPYQKRTLIKMIDIEKNGFIKNILYGEERNHIRCLNTFSSPSIIKTNICIYADDIYNDDIYNDDDYNDDIYNIDNYNNIKKDIESNKIDKILTIISLIKTNHDIKNNNKIIKSINGTKISIIENKKNLPQTLIICEHLDCDFIMEQFEIHCPSLKVYLNSTQKHNDNIVIGSWYDDKDFSEDDTKIINKERIIEEEIKDYDVILCSHILFSRFYKSVTEYKWNRIIIFDTEKYYLPYELAIYFNFMWFVMSNPYELYNKKKPFTGKIFGNEDDDIKGLMDYLIIMNKTEYIKNERNKFKNI